MAHTPSVTDKGLRPNGTKVLNLHVCLHVCMYVHVCMRVYMYVLHIHMYFACMLQIELRCPITLQI